ncbi:MAG TPA: cation-translocating P-type ATPase [Acidimicrobiia bacterium]
MTSPAGASPSAVLPWHARPLGDVLAELGTDPRRGLDEPEAARRLAVVGPNALAARQRSGALGLLLEQFRDVVVWVLVGAALVSGVLLGEWVEAGVIAAIVVLNAVLGFVQGARAEEALEALRRTTAPEATVRRNGHERRVPARDVVPGDMVLLGAGDRVPADVRLVDARHLRAAEAALTGESVPAAKQVDAVEEHAVLGDRHSMVFTGTTVVAGRGAGVVVATAGDTAVGGIARLMEEQEEEPTPLQRELASVGRRLALLAAGVAGLVFALGAARGYPSDEMFLTAVALGVAAIPEGLPAVVTITLARGTRRMAREHALVRRLAAVETLGATTVICTDKTGTLTRNEMGVQRVLTAAGDEEVAELDGEMRDAYARVASLCSDAHTGDEGEAGDPIEIALLRSVESAGVDPAVVRGRYRRVDELAFDATRKRMATLDEGDGALRMSVKGAPEVMAPRCHAILTTEGVVPLDDGGRRRLLDQAEELAAGGLRTLALAERVVEGATSRVLEDLEDGLVWIALVGLRDEPRDESPASVAEAKAAGVRVLMVTGDHPATASAIARDVGIADHGRVMAGRELQRLSEHELSEVAEQYPVFARVDPADKVKIVDAWKARGEVVAMTGDGVNDAPALRAADIGVAMGTGTDVGKDAADMVLADDNFASIVAAIREGRRIYLNLQKIVSFLLSANAAEVLLILAVLLIFGDAGAPLLATQILWINLVTDGLPVLALATDPAPPGIMSQPPRRTRSLLGAREQLRMLGRGAILAAGAFAALLYAHVVRDLPWEHVRTLVFTTLVGVQLGYVFVIRHEGHGWDEGRLPPNRWLAIAVAFSVALQVAVVATPVGHDLFDTRSLDALDWIVAAVVSALVPQSIRFLQRRDDAAGLVP